MGKLDNNQWAEDLSKWALKPDLPKRKAPHPNKVKATVYAVPATGFVIRFLYLNNEAYSIVRLETEMKEIDYLMRHANMRDLVADLAEAGMVTFTGAGVRLTPAMRELIDRLKQGVKK